MKLTPGTKYVYCSLNAFLTGAIIENVSRMPLDQFAKANLLLPWDLKNTVGGMFRLTARPDREISRSQREIRLRLALMLDDGIAGGQRILNHDWIAIVSPAR